MKRVVIVGCAARSMEWPSDAQVWVINQAGRFYTDPPIPTWRTESVFTARREYSDAGFPTPDVKPRWHRWFHLHGPEHIRIKNGEHALADVYAAARRGYKVIMPRPVSEPAVEAFPYEALVKEFGPLVGRYLTSSVAILPALAILEGFEEIALDGMQYGQDEPSEAWAVRCVEFWLGVSVGKGVKIVVPPGQGIMECDHVYGLEGPGSI